MKHINRVSKNGKLESRLVSLTMQHFHVAPLQRELRRCVHFLMSMKHFRQNDPKMTSYSQPVVKKAPPTLGRSRPSAFYSDAEPPRIGAQPVQPPPPAAPRPADASSVNLPLAATPMTPSHPPRPPKEALPKYPSMENEFMCQQACT